MTKLSGKAVFTSSGHDNCSLTGTFPVTGAATLNGATLLIDVGGAQVSFTLNKKGAGKSPHGTATLRISGGTATLKAALKNGAFAASWMAFGITAKKQTNTPVTLPVSVTLDGSVASTTKGVTYTSRNGTMGSFK